MSAIAMIQEKYRRAMHGPAWHGPALLEILKDLPESIALADPPVGDRRIADFVFHITTWQDATLRRMDGEILQNEAVVNWPPPGTMGPGSWPATMDRFRSSIAAVEAMLETLPESRLMEGLAVGATPAFHHLIGLITHAVWHGGQIALLRKALTSPSHASS